MAQNQTAPGIILSADSTCDLDPELKERYHVNYFPLHIILEGKDYTDNVDITPEDVYQAYYDRRVLPKTSAVNVQEYIDHFRPWVEAGYEVIHINLGTPFPAPIRTAAWSQKSSVMSTSSTAETSPPAPGFS